MAPKFPMRTVVLMALTLVAFIWFWWQTHTAAVTRAAAAAPTMTTPLRIELKKPLEVDGGTP